MRSLEPLPAPAFVSGMEVPGCKATSEKNNVNQIACELRRGESRWVSTTSEAFDIPAEGSLEVIIPAWDVELIATTKNTHKNSSPRFVIDSLGLRTLWAPHSHSQYPKARGECQQGKRKKDRKKRAVEPSLMRP